jgi:hypothetical protein
MGCSRLLGTLITEVNVKRFQDDLKVARRNWKNHRRIHVEKVQNAGIPAFNGTDNQVGRFRKRDAFDCGIPHCGICHSDKYPKRISTEQEKISDLGFAEQLEEFFANEDHA